MNQTTNNVKIRKFRVEDIKKILKLERECFKEPYDFLTFIYFWRRDPNGFLVAEADNDVIGYVIANSRFFRKEEGEIVSIAVKPKYRRKGIGKRLMLEAIRYLKSKGVKRVGLEVREGNKEAISFYELIGFKKAYVIPRYYSDGENAVKMFKQI
ncbi:ribosomal-protein-alanine N-acetyltransferase [Candidatus Geothermarchaeota archaeon]|nr:MAG: ribosomal-protein-alanine N-acetyltransferase [Candidatus Geothermarchaeota archaeon]